MGALVPLGVLMGALVPPGVVMGALVPLGVLMGTLVPLGVGMGVLPPGVVLVRTIGVVGAGRAASRGRARGRLCRREHMRPIVHKLGALRAARCRGRGRRARQAADGALTTARDRRAARRRRLGRRRHPIVHRLARTTRLSGGRPRASAVAAAAALSLGAASAFDLAAVASPATMRVRVDSEWLLGRRATALARARGRRRRRSQVERLLLERRKLGERARQAVQSAGSVRGARKRLRNLSWALGSAWVVGGVVTRRAVKRAAQGERDTGL